MLLDTTTRKLQVVLSAAKTTNDCPVVAAWMDTTTTSLTPGATPSNSNGVTAVDIVAAPAASTQRKINYLSVQNADTVATTVTVRYNDNATTYDEIKITIQPDESLIFTDRAGWYISPVTATGRYLGTTVLTSGTSFTTGRATKKIYIRLQAGGGAGGGGATGATAAAAGGGGSAGGYAEKTFVVTPNTAYTYAIGAGGTAGTAGNNPGNAGGNTTFAVGAVTVTANGGLGGAGMASGTSVLSALGGASPAVSTNGDLNAGGDPGGFAQRGSGTLGCSGYGGSSYLGAGGNAVNSQTGGSAGVGFGGGGSGGCTLNGGADVAGGAGKAGVIIVEEFTG